MDTDPKDTLEIVLSAASALLSLVFVFCSIRLFVQEKLSKIKVNPDQLRQYFGKKSFIYQRYIPKKKEKVNTVLKTELENGLLKARRHFYLPWFYCFFIWIFLFSSQLLKTCFEESKPNSTIGATAQVSSDSAFEVNSISGATLRANQYAKFDTSAGKETQKPPFPYQSLLTILSMLGNVFLLSAFGFLTTKTDVFDTETDENNYAMLRTISIVIFILVLLVEALVSFYSKEKQQTVHFVVETIVAIISVIAVFGTWGSMNNPYNNLGAAFKCVVFVYAASQIFAAFFPSDQEKIILSFCLVAFIGKLCIAWKLLKYVTSKRLSWFFLNELNEERTDTYSTFLNLLTEKNTNS
jgi:hypothetical protein